MHRSAPFTKQITGTGAALAVHCGFKPKFVLVYNLTQLSVNFATDTMTAAHVAQIDDSGAGTTDVLATTSAGITLTPNGFKLGTNAALNTASDVIHVVAW